MPNSNNTATGNVTSTDLSYLSTSTTSLFGIDYNSYIGGRYHIPSMSFNIPPPSPEEQERDNCETMFRNLIYAKTYLNVLTQETIFTLPESIYIRLLNHENKYNNAAINEDAPEFQTRTVKIRNAAKYNAIDWDKYIESGKV